MMLSSSGRAGSATFHSRTVPSSAAVARIRPSRRKSTESTCPVAVTENGCPSWVSWPGSARHIWSFRSEEHTSELQSLRHLVCRLLLEKKNDHAHTLPLDGRVLRGARLHTTPPRQAQGEVCGSPQPCVRITSDNHTLVFFF